MDIDQNHLFMQLIRDIDSLKQISKGAFVFMNLNLKSELKKHKNTQEQVVLHNIQYVTIQQFSYIFITQSFTKQQPLKQKILLNELMLKTKQFNVVITLNENQTTDGSPIKRALTSAIQFFGEQVNQFITLVIMQTANSKVTQAIHRKRLQKFQAEMSANQKLRHESEALMHIINKGFYLIKKENQSSEPIQQFHQSLRNLKGQRNYKPKDIAPLALNNKEFRAFKNQIFALPNQIVSKLTAYKHKKQQTFVIQKGNYLDMLKDRYLQKNKHIKMYNITQFANFTLQIIQLVLQFEQIHKQIYCQNQKQHLQNIQNNRDKFFVVIKKIIQKLQSFVFDATFYAMIMWIKSFFNLVQKYNLFSQVPVQFFLSQQFKKYFKSKQIEYLLNLNESLQNLIGKTKEQLQRMKDIQTHQNIALSFSIHMASFEGLNKYLNQQLAKYFVICSGNKKLFNDFVNMTIMVFAQAKQKEEVVKLLNQFTFANYQSLLLIQKILSVGCIYTEIIDKYVNYLCDLSLFNQAKIICLKNKNLFQSKEKFQKYFQDIVNKQKEYFLCLNYEFPKQKQIQINNLMSIIQASIDKNIPKGVVQV